MQAGEGSVKPSAPRLGRGARAASPPPLTIGPSPPGSEGPADERPATGTFPNVPSLCGGDGYSGLRPEPRHSASISYPSNLMWERRAP